MTHPYDAECRNDAKYRDDGEYRNNGEYRYEAEYSAIIVIFRFDFFSTVEKRGRDDGHCWVFLDRCSVERRDDIGCACWPAVIVRTCAVLRAKLPVAALPDVLDFIYFMPDTTDTRVVAAIRSQRKNLRDK